MLFTAAAGAFHQITDIKIEPTAIGILAVGYSLQLHGNPPSITGHLDGKDLSDHDPVLVLFIIDPPRFDDHKADLLLENKAPYLSEKRSRANPSDGISGPTGFWTGIEGHKPLSRF